MGIRRSYTTVTQTSSQSKITLDYFFDKMKLITAASFCGMTMATFDQMKQDMSQIVNRYVRGLMEADRNNMRNIPDILGANLDNINEYGCWCYFMDGHGRGHAKPVDGLDRFCRKLSMGYDCAILDVIDETGNDTCVPWEVFYISGTCGGEAALVQTCETFNSDSCAIKSCKVEGIFVLKVFNLFVGGGSISDAFKHSNGFDEKVNCIVDNCKDDPDRCDPTRECCGDCPDRFPYKPMGGDRGCCAGIAFDASILTCCSDGTPRLSC